MIRRSTALLFAVLLLASCQNQGGNGSAAGGGMTMQGTPVALLDYVTAAPASWQSRAPSSNMRLAEYAVAGAAGGDSAEVVVYFFGAGQGGSVDANIERWKGQFTDAGGTHPEPTITRISDAAFPTTVVELRGTYARGIGMGDQAAPKPDQVLLAGVVETPKGSLYIQDARAHRPGDRAEGRIPALRASDPAASAGLLNGLTAESARRAVILETGLWPPWFP